MLAGHSASVPSAKKTADLLGPDDDEDVEMHAEDEARREEDGSADCSESKISRVGSEDSHGNRNNRKPAEFKHSSQQPTQIPVQCAMGVNSFCASHGFLFDDHSHKYNRIGRKHVEL